MRISTQNIACSQRQMCTCIHHSVLHCEHTANRTVEHLINTSIRKKRKKKKEEKRALNAYRIRQPERGNGQTRHREWDMERQREKQTDIRQTERVLIYTTTRIKHCHKHHGRSLQLLQQHSAQPSARVRLLHDVVLTQCLVAVVVTAVRVLHSAVLTWFPAVVVLAWFSVVVVVTTVRVVHSVALT